MSTAIKSGFDAAAFEAFAAGRKEPQWLRDWRSAAWGTFLATPLPDRRQEEWKKSDVRGLKLEQFAPPAESGSAAAGATMPAALLSHGVELAGRSESLDGRPVESYLDPELAKQGVLFGSLDALAVQHEALVRPWFEKNAVAYDVDKFAALHAALWSGGVLLYVPKGVVLEKPLHALAAMSPSGVDFARTIVVLDEGAEATFLSETASIGDEAGLHSGATEVHLGKGARLRYVSLQNWNHKTWHFAHQKVFVGEDARLQWTVGALGSRSAKVNQQVHLVGERSEAQVNGVMFAEGRQQIAYHTLQYHRSPSAVSDLLYKGALQDEAKMVWRGMIKVDPGAQKTNGYQRNDNLMLSSTSRVDSIPGLEIEADDVICTHGATTGRVEEEQVFYAQSRGLTRKEAARMIVAGFFQQVFDRITIDSVRNALAEAVGQRIREF